MYTIEYHKNYQKAHHTKNGFRNWQITQEESPNFWRAFSWISQRMLLPQQKQPAAAFRKVTAEDFTNNFKHYRIHWLGHATVLIRTHSLTFITDPIFSERASPVSFAGPQRIPPLPLLPENLPKIELVVISHNHYDHLDEFSVKKLWQLFAPLFVVPLRMKDILLSWGITRVVELDWWQSLVGNGFKVYCLPAKHFSARGLIDRNSVLWASFLVEVTDKNKVNKFYFAGDTGYSFHFRAIGEEFTDIDVAMIPIGAYNPRWFMQAVHVDPEEAVQAFLDLKAKEFLAIHWGTFDLADEPLGEPAERALAEAERQKLNRQNFHVLPIGGYFSN